LNSWKPSKDDDTSGRSLGGASPKNALPAKLIPPKDNKQVAVDHNAITQGKAKLKKVDTKAQRKEGQKHDGGIASILARRVAIEHSDSESERSDSDGEWDNDEDEHQTPPNHQSDNKKGTSIPERGYNANSGLKRE
jgi:hypothetical protein